MFKDLRLNQQMTESESIHQELLLGSYFEHLKYAEELFKTGNKAKGERMMEAANKIMAEIQEIKAGDSGLNNKRYGNRN